MSRTALATTFRLQNVPGSLIRAQLPSFLADNVTLFATENISDTQIHIHSLAPAIGDWNKQPLHTATLTFDVLPEFLQDARHEQWELSGPNLPIPLILDCHFLDFTVLNSVPDEVHLYEYACSSPSRVN